MKLSHTIDVVVLDHCCTHVVVSHCALVVGRGEFALVRRAVCVRATGGELRLARVLNHTA